MYACGNNWLHLGHMIKTEPTPFADEGHVMWLKAPKNLELLFFFV